MGFSASPASKAWIYQDEVKRMEELEDGEVCCNKRHRDFTHKLTATLLIYIRPAQDWGGTSTFHHGRGKGS